MTDERTYDFSTLSERISAQTQAYVEFSNALVKIIEQTAQIRDSVSENNHHLLEDYKELNNKFQNLLLDLNNFFSENKYQHKNFDDDLDSFKSSLISYESKLNNLIDQMNKNNSELFNMIENVVKHSKQIKEDHSLQKNETQSSYDSLLKKIDSLSTKMDDHNELVTGFRKSIDKYKIFLWCAGSLIAILGALSQFGILSLNWFKK